MKRRDFLMAASGVAGGTAAAGAATPAAASPPDPGTTHGGEDETTTDGEGTTTEGGGDGTTAAGDDEPDETVIVGPGGQLEFDPASLTVSPGTTVLFDWDSDRHNVVVDSQPDEASWEGTPGDEDDLYDTGYTYTHTFEVEGTYDYYCAPHLSAGMEASITVEEGGGDEVRDVSPEEMGVPFRAHYVGIAAMLSIVLSVLFAFFQLKYAESPNTSSPNRER